MVMRAEDKITALLWPAFDLIDMIMAGIGEFQPVRDDQTGELYLPGTRRPDGSWRKPRRVKEGYIPQDEVPVYESKGKQWAKSQSAYPVGMSPAVIAAQEREKEVKASIPGLPPAVATATKAAKKKKKKTGTTESVVKETTSKLAGFTIQEPDFGTQAAGKEKKNSAEPKSDVKSSSGGATAAPAASAAPSTSVADPAKKLKNLKKKLRDTEMLEEKIKSGELKNPDKDQLEKVKRKKEVLKEIKELEKIVK